MQSEPLTAPASAEIRLQEEARSLATRQPVGRARGRRRRSLAPHLEALERTLGAVYQELSAWAPPPEELPQAVEWLLDNDYVIQEALEQVKRSLPPAYYRRLPVLSSGPKEGSPRAYELARSTLETIGRPFEVDEVSPFLDAYQEVSPLSIGELWALPALLRLVVLEDLAQEARRLSEAGFWSDMGKPGGAEVGWAVQALRDLAAHDWQRFFEAASLVERELRQDPAGVYPKMDFATRDRYRKAVETVARWTDSGDETVVAETALRLASEGTEHEPVPARSGHVGTYLVAEGRTALEAALRCRAPRRVRAGRRLARRATGLYLSAVGAIWLLSLAAPGFWLATLGVTGAGLALGLFLASGAALGLAVSLVDWLATLIRPPRVLPRMDFEGGLPEEGRTLVVMPVIVSQPEEVEVLLSHLEVHFLGNRDPRLSFALLTDLADAPERVRPGDEEILKVAREGIRDLNRRYTEPGHERFHLLHRERRWNPSEERWMGWERKRGKLEELNLLLRGDRETSFTVQVGVPADLAGVRYVLTLDADTRLPPGSAAELVAVFAHPLNRPRLDPASGRVTSGYTVLQPRLAIEPSAAYETHFSRIFAGEVGLDLYTRAVSDVYHDLFGEAVFAGKGIYDVGAFERTLRDRVPENRLLSHDLFEGVHGRVGLVSDVVLLEDYPSRPLLYARRLHRWVRGDWQLLPWLLPWVPSREHGWIRNQLSLLDRWKILDNLRRSLYPPSLLGLFVVAWLGLPPAASAAATVGIAALLAAPIVFGALGEVRRGVAGRAWRPALESAAHGVRLEAARWALSLALLAHQSLVALDAVARTLYRLGVSHRKLLEWTSAAHAARAGEPRRSRGSLWRGMWPAPVLSGALAATLALVAPGSLPAAAPCLLLWLLSPEVAHWAGRSAARAPELLGEAERRRLRLLARQTWRFFEELVGPGDHWLPPDHLQQEPGPVVAHRTSPTNVAMLLLSTLAAHDLGYLGSRELAQRVRQTLDTLDRMERYRGHWLNWYDTRDLHPFEPRYVSTVDSGNLAAALLVLGDGLERVRGDELVDPRRPAGVADTVGVLRRIVVEDLTSTTTGAPGKEARSLGATLREVETDLRAVAGRSAERRREVLGEVEARLGAVAESVVGLLERLPHPPAAQVVADLRAWIDHAVAEARSVRLEAAEPSAEESTALVAELRALGRRASRAAWEPDFSFLYDDSRELFRIGYDVSAGAADPNHYDLLASEARIASFLAIAKGDVPVEHWIHLGRPVTRRAGSRVLLSWGGTMFEYLMPRLVLRHPERTLLEESCRVAVASQASFGERYGIPWGISESGFSELGVHGDYQYRAFGVPELGFKRDLGERLVVAPYASLLALAVRPRAVMENVESLVRLGALGRYGFFEALDFGPSEGRTSEPPQIVRSYMAHHQGMILVAADNLLRGDPMVERLHVDPHVESVELLLHEQIPRAVPTRVRWRRSEAAAAEPGVPREEPAGGGSWEVPVRGAFPRRMPLSNGSYSVLVGAAGGGGSRWGDVALTRHRLDPSVEAWGTWIYLKDLDSGDLWSAALEPTGGERAECTATFGPGRVELTRRHGDVFARTVVAVAEDLAELRHVRLTNEALSPRRLLLASYAEVVLAPEGEDRRHPAFSKLFVESELRPDHHGGGVLLFRRRPRSPEEGSAVLGHALVLDRSHHPELLWETDRARFLGRGRDGRSPLALEEPSRGFTGTAGAPLDPILSLGAVLELAPGESREVTFLTAAGPSEAVVLRALQALGTQRRVEWALERVGSRSEAELAELGLGSGEVRELTELLSLVLAPREALRAGLDTTTGPIEPALWAHGISGDLPILLLRLTEPEGMDLARLLLRGHAWWRSRRVGIDLVILDQVSSGYEQPLRDRLERAAADLSRRAGGRGPGKAVILPEGQLRAELPDLLAAARVVLDTSAGPLAAQLARAEAQAAPMPAFVPVPGSDPPAAEVPPLVRPAALLADNGLGGFLPDGEATGYALFLAPGRRPPAPWINVIANPGFGFLVSESGASCTWSANSGEARLTPWPNDPVSDPSGEALYLRDEETAEVWSPTPAPAPAPAPYEVRHLPGRTLFRHRSHGLEQELELFVDPEAPVKLAVLRLRDLWRRPRRITATYWADWVLGAHRERTGPFLVPELDRETGALFARTLSGPLAGRGVAFLAASRPAHGLTADRTEFLGPAGDPAHPEALRRIGLSGAVHPGLDACAAYQIHLDVAPEGVTEAWFVLGMGRDRQEARDLVHRFRAPDAARLTSHRVAGTWQDLLGRIVVETPEPALDRMLNLWLPYQAVACRLWARTALYQSSGAYGFRDQLQDAANLAPVAPELAREQVLRAAAHQFEEGDVLHWWHPDTGFGVRTRCSDDLLWLPWACARYVEVTGDAPVLEESVPYLAAPELEQGKAERFGRYAPGGRVGSLYDHCLRAIERGSTRGRHGLPLIGSGDWNDGLNRLGREGRGESVWLGWFLCAVLRSFAPLCELRGEAERAEELRRRAEELAAAVEEHGWDGAWYRRAFDDQGRPVGSAGNDECRIDLIAQAWAVLSGAGDPERAATAMASAREHLLRQGDGLLLLLAPPFDRAEPDPGYIRAYPAGVRENGGQYTHGAVWGAWAFAELGDGDLAVELLRMLSPVEKTATPEGVERYRVEPYAVAADVYGAPPHVGRGGWTWYTGTAAWLWRYGVEAVLGLRRRGATLEVDPCIARAWPGFRAEIREGGAVYEIRVENPDGVCRGVASVELDGRRLDASRIPLRDDRRRHRVVLRLGPLPGRSVPGGAA